MVTQSYEVKVINHQNGDVLRIYSMAEVTAFRYSREHNGIGRIAMTVPYVDGIEAIFALDNFVEVYRLNESGGVREREETYLVRNTDHYKDDALEYFTVGGVSLNHLLLRRVIVPTEDSLVAGGFSTKAGVASEVMAAYANEQIGTLASDGRRITELSVRNDDTGITVGARERYGSLFDLFKKLARQGDVDFQINRLDSNTMELFIGKIGTDLSIPDNLEPPFVVLSPLRGNLIDPRYTIKRDQESTQIYVLGEGEPGNQKIITISSSTNLAHSTWNRIERVHKSSNNKNTSLLDLVNKGREVLIKHLPEQEFDFTVSVDSAGARYNVDWTISDIITFKWGSVQDNLRIKKVEVSVSPTNDSVKLTVEQLEDV